jgi:hypothetical protein
MKDIIFTTNGPSDSFRSKPFKVKTRIDNITSTTAPFVAVESNGEVNKIAKADLIDVLFCVSSKSYQLLG